MKNYETVMENNNKIIVGAIDRGNISHAMILDCILVEVVGDEWRYMEFRFKNTDKDDKEIEIAVGTGFNRNFSFFLN